MNFDDNTPEPESRPRKSGMSGKQFATYAGAFLTILAVLTTVFIRRDEFTTYMQTQATNAVDMHKAIADLNGSIKELNATLAANQRDMAKNAESILQIDEKITAIRVNVGRLEQRSR